MPRRTFSNGQEQREFENKIRYVARVHACARDTVLALAYVERLRGQRDAVTGAIRGAPTEAQLSELQQIKRGILHHSQQQAHAKNELDRAVADLLSNRGLPDGSGVRNIRHLLDVPGVSRR